MTLKGLAQLTEKHKKEMETEVAIQSINELFAHKSAQSVKGWKLVRDPSLMCLNITAKLASTVSENQIYKNFVEG
jgi:predicted nuclease of restriction endonuclease-like RecB superfamily